MFRLLYMTFFGTRRLAAAHAPSTEHAAPGTSTAHDAHNTPHDDHHAGHGGGHLHDAPAAMAIALVVLAIGAVLAGYVGVPEVLMHGGNKIEAFLEPSFRAVGSEGVAEVAEAAVHGDARTEMSLMLLSTLVGFAGIGVATFFFLKRPSAADAMMARFSGVYRLLLGKYFVDEFYNSVIVQPIKNLSGGLLWKGVDAGIIDGIVNGVGMTVRAGSGALRRLQTGSVRAYAMSLFVGVVAIVGYYLWP
jgi:NADH-quinone oxidoreductase subunit L